MTNLLIKFFIKDFLDSAVIQVSAAVRRNQKEEETGRKKENPYLATEMESALVFCYSCIFRLKGY